MEILFDYEYLKLSLPINNDLKMALDKIRRYFVGRLMPLKDKIDEYQDAKIVLNVFGNIKYSEGIEPPFLICYNMPIELGDKISESVDESDTQYLYKILGLTPPSKP